MDTMDTKEPKKKKNKALILVIIISLLTIFIISVSLIMAKNIATQKNKTAETNTAKDILSSTDAKALAKAKLMQEQELAVQKATSTKPAALTASAENETRGVLKINISSNGFKPLSITATMGTTINTEITNTDTVVHNITFENQELAKYNNTIAPGETKKLNIKTPTTPGTYPFFCSIPEHAKNDETGKIIIK